MSASRKRTLVGVSGDLTVRRVANTVRRDADDAEPPPYTEMSISMSRDARAAVRRVLIASRNAIPEYLFRDLLVALGTADAYEDELQQVRAALGEARRALDALREALEPIAPEPAAAAAEPAEPVFRGLGRWHVWELPLARD